MTTKYAPLTEHLHSLQVSEWRAGFTAIESVLQTGLPESANGHAAWWSNGGHRHARAWMDAGFETCELKQSHRTPAKGMYASDWFMKARTLVEAQGWPWFILSAQHGLLHPDKEIAPYEKTLNTMRKAERQAWASDVMEALERHLGAVRTIVFFAGQRYREFFVPKLQKRGIQCDVPMEGLKIGEQLAWLNGWIKH